MNTNRNSSVVATETFDVYKFSYNTDGKILSSTVNGKLYASYTYNDDGNPTEINYANGQSIRYEYDGNGNLWKQYHNNDTEPYVTYEYKTAPEKTEIDTQTNLDTEENVEVETNEDYVLKAKTNTDSNLYYEYFNSGKVTVAKADDKDNIIYFYTVSKDDDSSTSTKSGTLSGKSYSTVTDNKKTSFTYGNNTLSAESNIQDKTTSTAVKANDTTAFTVTETENTTADVKSYGNNLAFTDTYANSNKAKIVSSSDGTNTTNYTYYSDGQLKAVTGSNYTASYVYDGRGNLTTKTVNGTSTSYSYENDRLTAVGNTGLTYDGMGNVLTYGDKSYTWRSGRNLASITDGGNTYSYTYNKYGYRTSKTVNGVTTDFNVDENGNIVSQSDGTNTLYFEYNTDGTPLGFVLNDMQYIYITNNSGDVMAIADSTGSILATYSYNEWGKVTVNATGDENIAVANLNPLRYRGYYYDSETGYYYLQSRYYDPEICRFINADLPEYAKVQMNEAAGLNIFAYCCNDPVNDSDPSGKLAFTLLLKSALGALIGAASYILSWYIFKHFTGEKFSVVDLIISIGIGAVNGIISYLNINKIASFCVDFALNFLSFVNSGYKLLEVFVIALVISIVSSIISLSVSKIFNSLKKYSVSPKKISKYDHKISASWKKAVRKNKYAIIRKPLHIYFKRMNKTLSRYVTINIVSSMFGSTFGYI